MNMADVSSIVASVAAIIATFFAAKAAWEARNAVRAQVFVTLNDIYFAPEMVDAMKVLSKLKEEYPNDFPDNFDEDDQKLYQSRRLAKSYFARIFRLREGNLIKKKDEKLLIHKQQVDFLVNVLEPIEKALNPDLPGLDERMYQHFKQLYAELS